MFDGLIDFITIIKDSIVSTFEGIKMFISSYTMIQTISQTAAVWMPTAMVGICTVALLFLVTLRILGR